MHRRGILRSAFVAAAAALGFGRFATPARAQTKHIRLYVEMDVPPAREREMLDTFHNVVRAGGGEARGLHPREDAQAPQHHCRARRRPSTTTASSWSSRAKSSARSGLPRPATSACGRSSSAP